MPSNTSSNAKIPGLLENSYNFHFQNDFVFCFIFNFESNLGEKAP